MAPKLAYPSVVGRVHNLFHSATKVFKGDHRLWLQYIDFALRSKSGRAAGKIFAEAISLHPNFVPFWITAASWEYFSNHNIHAARVLLQRANRLNPQSKEILLEYCRLELCYREKVMQRLEVFGVEDSDLKEAAVSLSDVPDGKKGDKGALEQISDLNANSGLGSSRNGSNENAPGSNKASDIESAKKKNPFFAGAIPIAVFNAAIKAFPSDLGLRAQFALIVNSFADTTLISNAIYNSIEKDFSEDAAAQSFIARRPYDNPPKIAKPVDTKKKKKESESSHESSTFDVHEATNNCVANFEAQLASSTPSVALYENYIAFLLEVLAKVDSSFAMQWKSETTENSKSNSGTQHSALAAFLRKKVVLVFKEAYANGHYSETLCSKWLDTLLALERLDDAMDAAEKYTSALPSNPLVHTYYFSLIGQIGEYYAIALKNAEDEKKSKKVASSAKNTPSKRSTTRASFKKQHYDTDESDKSDHSDTDDEKENSKKSAGLASDATEEGESRITMEAFQSPKLKKYLNLKSEELSNRMAAVLKSGLDLTHPASGDLFIMYWNHVLDSDAKSVDEDSRRPDESIALAAAMNHYKRTLATLRGAALAKFKSNTLTSAISRWHRQPNSGEEEEYSESSASVARIRAVYQSGLNASPTTLEYFTLCINFETSLNVEQSNTIARRLFESAASDFGKEEKDFWLSYIDWETALGQHSNASQLFTRAKRTLHNPDDFILEYNRKMDAQFKASSTQSASSKASMDTD